MWFLFFFVAIPFVLFVGLYLVSIIVIFLINKIFHKKYSQLLSFVLPCFSLIFYFMLIMGGISFKYIDPQYYKFKKLCKEAESETLVYDDKLYKIYKTLDSQTFFPATYYDKKTQQKYLMSDFKKRGDSQRQEISSRIAELQNILYYHHDDNPFLYYKQYYYVYYGIFLKGDEGAGWYINFDGRRLECKCY